MCNVIKTFKRKGISTDVYVLGKLVCNEANGELHDSYYLMGVFASLKGAQSEVTEEVMWKHIVRDETQLYRHAEYIEESETSNEWATKPIKDFISEYDYDTHWYVISKVDMSIV